MPTKKNEETKTPETEVAKAIVSELGVNDEPTPSEPKVVRTKNGNTITYN